MKHLEIQSIIQTSIDVKKALHNDENLINKIHTACEQIISVFERGGKLWLAGNGGSAADAQHIAAELTGRFKYDRMPLPAEALHVNTSYLTAVANDYGYEYVYERMIIGSAKEGDCFIGISTSGHSPNIVNALKAAKSKNIYTILLTGRLQKPLDCEVDLVVDVPSTETARIQESHILIGHILCEIVESRIFPRD